MRKASSGESAVTFSTRMFVSGSTEASSVPGRVSRPSWLVAMPLNILLSKSSVNVSAISADTVRLESTDE